MVGVSLPVVGILVTKDIERHPRLTVLLLIVFLAAVGGLVERRRRVRLKRRIALGIAAGIDDPLPIAARSLADAVRKQWRTEARIRGLLDDEDRPTTMVVRWACLSDKKSTDLPLRSGSVNDLVALSRRPEGRRLVVLGQPGSGKTTAAVFLTLGLLKGDEVAKEMTEEMFADDPVRVLMTLGSWDPETEDLTGWLARRLGDDHAWLRNKTAYGKDAPRRLIENGNVLPVLDGLDEVKPESRQQKIIEAIENLIAPTAGTDLDMSH